MSTPSDRLPSPHPEQDADGATPASPSSPDASGEERARVEESQEVSQVLRGGGEMGRLMRQVDWRATGLGPVADWPQSLRTSVSTCLNSRFPILLWWGRELVMLYNDAYRPILGRDKHPQALGRGGREVWPEVWHIIGPMLEGVLNRGEATWSENTMLPLVRGGFVEECYFTFSYSPILDESGGVGGVFTAVYETTGQVLGERRLRALQELSLGTAAARSTEEACGLAADVLRRHSADVPFSRFYLLDEDGHTVRLAAFTGMAPELTGSVARLDLSTDDREDWSLRQVLRSGTVLHKQELERRYGRMMAAGGEHAVDAALVLPWVCPGETRPSGVLVAGLSPHLALDEKYRGFLDLVSGQVATAVGRVRVLQEARRRAEVLAELDRSKTEFFSNVSHEFRTPLTLMLAPLEEVLARSGEGLQGEELQTVHRNCLRLLKLVNTLLDFSRLEAGRVEASFEPVDLAALTTDLVSNFRSVVEQAGLRLSVECEVLPELVWVDPELWEKVVFNLLSNAFKFTFEGGIRVRLRALEHSVELSVEDTGIGIAPEEVAHVFERFHRAAGARGRSIEGSGIGLSLVRELVKLHAGSVRVDSRVGQGSTFTVCLPRGQGHLPRERLRAPRPLPSMGQSARPFLEEMRQWTAMSPNAPPELAASTLEPRRASPSAQLLLVDDNADMRHYLRRLLEVHWRVQAVADGRAALEAARQQPPDLVLSDVMMPGLDGFALLRELRADPRTQAVPIILLSARAGEEATVEGMNAGADDYLVKPFSARELLARVRSQLSLSHLRREALQQARQRVEFEQQLIGIVSHDLRNPISAVLLSAHALLKREELSERATKNAARIVSSAERALRLVRDLLDFTQARLGTGLPVEPRPMDLHEVLRASLEELAVAYPERELLVEYGGQGRGEWDSERLGQVVQNLVGNALRYSPVDTPVRVTTRDEGEHLLLSVSNQGPPIPEELLPRIFNALQRGTAQRDTAGRGVGLGLFIVEQIIRAHGGSIEVRSTEAEGTSFRVLLPRHPPRRLESARSAEPPGRG